MHRFLPILYGVSVVSLPQKQDLLMASISPSTWASVPTSLSSHTVAAGATAPGAKFISFPPRRFKSRKAFSASSSEDCSSTGEAESPDPVQLALSKANAYIKAKSSPPPPAPMSSQKSSPEPEVPAAVKLAMEKAKEYKKIKGVSVEESKDPGQEDLKLKNSRKVWVDGKLNKKDELKISSKDFLGLNFSEKKNYRGKPPGLAPYVAPLGDGDASEVEIIVGDASKFERTSPASTSGEVDDKTGLYKPKVSTWGVFPRPNNISKTFGGGRVIQPGERLETTETKETKEKHTRELIAAYKRRMGLTIDTKTRVECEKALKEGDNLMDRGQLKQALPYYEEVMKSLAFQSELHGLAALQWSICQDSLSRPNEARTMYEKLQSHPNAEVSKKARQFVFSFQAMEMMKVKGSSFSSKTGYEDYFEAFVEKKASYIPSVEEQNETVLDQTYPYLIFVLSPIFIILFVAVKKLF